MPSVDDLELLSRYLGGELPSPEAMAVKTRLALEPELREALAAMHCLVEEAARLPGHWIGQNRGPGTPPPWPLRRLSSGVHD